MPKVKVGDINMYYEVHGEGEPLVMIAGMGGDSTLYYPDIPFFSQHYKVVLVDNRGAGQSDAPDIPYTMEMMADDLAGLLDATGIHSAHVLGGSLGGVIAQYFALRYPERVMNLILASCGCRPMRPQQDSETAKMMVAARSMTPEEAQKVRMALFTPQEFIDRNPGAVEEVLSLAAMHPAPPHGIKRQQQAAAGHDTCERLPQIKAPVLVMHGDTDRLAPVEAGRLLASRLPDAELVILKNAGHYFMEDATRKIILDFLNRHSSTGKGD